jgi:hypothetical protein
MSGKATNSPIQIDPILGERKLRQNLKALGKEVLVPLFRKDPVTDKLIRDVDIYYVMPDYHYLRRLDFLNLLKSNIFEYYTRAVSTQYFKSVKNPFLAYLRAWKYRRLYKSIKKNGIRSNKDNVWTVPWLFASRECILRLDGSHRASIARYLGYNHIKVLLLTPGTLLNMKNIPDDYKSILNTLGEPEVDLSDSSSLHK